MERGRLRRLMWVTVQTGGVLILLVTKVIPNAVHYQEYGIAFYFFISLVFACLAGFVLEVRSFRMAPLINVGTPLLAFLVMIAYALRSLSHATEALYPGETTLGTGIICVLSLVPLLFASVIYIQYRHDLERR